MNAPRHFSRYDSKAYLSTDGDGTPIPPQSGVVPILLELERGLLKVVGTAFYVTRYGLFLTAAHVLHDALDAKGASRGRVFILHVNDEKIGGVHLRLVTRFSYDRNIDVALGEADNFGKRFPENPLMNRRGHLLRKNPPKNAKLSIFGYPENEYIDFRDHDHVPNLAGDFFSGRLSRLCDTGDHPFMPYRHFETTIYVGSGASGAPVFFMSRICGIAARGWDFRGGEFERNDLSYVVPVEHCLRLGLDRLPIPNPSWERKQVPQEQVTSLLTLSDLIQYGHVTA